MKSFIFFITTTLILCLACANTPKAEEKAIAIKTDTAHTPIIIDESLKKENSSVLKQSNLEIVNSNNEAINHKKEVASIDENNKKLSIPNTTIDTPIQSKTIESIPEKTNTKTVFQKNENSTTTVIQSPKSEINEITIEEKTKVKQPIKTELDHSKFQKILSTFVSKTGDVDYQGLVKNKATLDEYITELQANPIDKSWSKDKQLAYWINAYNAFTLKLMVDNYPVNSITDLEGGKPWDKSWIKIGDKTYSLNNIENDIIRPQFNDARIHFAVNCAAKSCPPLGNFAYTEANLQSKLESQTKKFINSNSNKISENEIAVSKIFEWYASDFGDLINYINKYAETKVSSGATIKYLEYDWALNGK